MEEELSERKSEGNQRDAFSKGSSVKFMRFGEILDFPRKKSGCKAEKELN